MNKRGDPVCCKECGTTSTPLWRYGPEGSKSLCNACGIRWKRANKAKLNGGIRKRKLSVGEKKLKKPKMPLMSGEEASDRSETFDHFVQTVEDEYDLICPASPEEHSLVSSDNEAAFESDVEVSPVAGLVFSEEDKQRMCQELWLQFLNAPQLDADSNHLLA